ncbi:sialic acid-binding Ig-like lectin 5 isoform X1 [Synchiropus splendidus]|uniref:sialic acid-binding Ig-like lectin 5 isoform X1 n=1 Tax=Synchiropus splendidus TaxID=270530 RepID=UPI00237E9629|nr:sialic acid-binding Ig-like lectin 5 isoform X1 [Synchiropus splendidus]
MVWLLFLPCTDFNLARMKSVVMIILTSALVQAGLKETCPHRGYCVSLASGVITAESGLCVEIPCSFKTPQSFTPQHMLWFRCVRQGQDRCDRSSDPICSTDSSSAIRKGFEGRVSLLESDVSQRNCSIIINDLSPSDSGWYQLRLTRKDKGYTYRKKQGISVRGLRQKPTLAVPQLKEGQLTALTCTAPGLCSGSEPTISWKWEGKGKSPHLVGGNITLQKSVSLGAVRRQYSSTLIFSASSEHHSSSITCTVVFKHGGSTEVKKTLAVQYLKSLTITGQTLVREGETLSLHCAADSFPPVLVQWTKGKTSEALARSTGEALKIPAVTKEHSGPYRCTAEQGSKQVMEEVHVKVKYVRTPIILGNTDVKKGRALNLTCASESYPESVITMKKEERREKTISFQAANTNTLSVLIPNVTTEDSGRYICEARYEMETLTTSVNVTVTWFAGILNGSRCERDSAALTCVCGSQGHPLPSISWLLLTDHSDSHIQTNVSGDEIWSSFSVKDGHSVKTVVCVVTHENGETKEELPVLNHESLFKFLTVEVLVAFLVGVFLSGIIFFVLQLICCRNTKKMQKHMEIPLTNGADRQTPKAETAVGERGPQEPEPGLKDVDYSTINFFHMKGKSPHKAPETMETEYSEIKRQDVTTAAEESVKKREKQEGNNQVFRKQETDPEMALYSNIRKIGLGTTQ